MITNYTPTAYGAHEQIWAALQGPDDRFYFANGDGLLVYDNNGWELISLTNKSHVRSLGLSADSTLYIGGDGEIGYLRTDAYGRLQYVSLLDKLPPSERVFGRVWTTAAIDGKMHFQTYERLFVWNGKAFRVYPTGGRLLRTFPLNGTLYGGMEGKGLVYWTGKGFKLLPRGEYFAGKTSIRMILPYDQGKLLIGTESGELVLYDHQSLTPFRTEAAPQLARYGLERGCWLDGEHFALAMGSSGLYIFSREGKLLQLLDDESGLYSNQILSCYVDRKGNLWLGTQSGISKVALGEPLRLTDRRDGLRGSVDQVVAHEGKLFIGTKEGLFVAEQNPSVYSAFRWVSLFQDRIWALHPVGASLLVGHSDGVFEWREGRLTQLNAYSFPAAFYPSAVHPGLVWASIDDGCVAMRYENPNWREVGKKRGLAGSVRGLVEYRKGEVWLGSRARGVYRLRYGLTENGLPAPELATVRNFTAANGLPPGDAVPLLVGSRLCVFVKQTGQLFAYQEKEEKFVPHPGFAARLGLPGDQIAAWYTQPDGTFWLRTSHPSTGKNTLVRTQRQPDGRHHTQSFAIPSNLSSFANCLYISHKRAFFGGLAGVLIQELNPRVTRTPDRIVPLLTSVQLQQRPVAFRDAAIRIPFQRNAALRLHFAAPFFSATDEIRYQTRLVGFEAAWSAWGGDNFKEYTNLSEGKYEFRVRAIDAFGRVSQVAGWQFAVTPPWYRQWWVYGAYLLGLVSVGYGVIRWRSFRLEAENLRLENTVAERTAQLARQHNQLRNQSEKLRQLDGLKSRFFANISHEFRTPLTLIIGLVRKQQQTDPAPDKKEDYAVVLHNAHRLLRLINQLLELSRLEAGSARLQARQADVIPFLRRITASFASLAEQKRIGFTFNKSLLLTDQTTVPVYLYFDAERLEQVITNLLANAVKFTPEQGAVDLLVAVVDNAVEIQVQNTGPGIPTGSLPYVFDRFYQASGPGSHEGTGIGLALVKELVTLHQGSVQVASIPDEKTVFTVRLPLGNGHLSSEELIERASSAEESLPLAEQFNGDAEPTATPLTPTAEPDRPVVLVVEDHPDLRTYIREQLLTDYLVLEAEAGEKGWQLAEETLPDLVVSDVMMPGMNGLELLARLKNGDKTSHIPVILLTAKAGRENKLEGLGAGADDYLVKPFDAEELRVRVGNLIRTRQQLREKFTTRALLEPGQVRLPSQQQVFVEKLHRVLEQHLDNELFGVEQLGEELGMSRSQIHRKVKAITNLSPSELIRSYRLQRAADLIRQDAGNFSEIAWRTGFSSLSHFSRSFHEEYGCSPSEYKKLRSSTAPLPKIDLFS
ncbi:MAG: response regulator [Ferruginibacter sp.]|nr:response regulator [Cytophagales bacterium]